MKKLWIFSASALALFAAAGCNDIKPTPGPQTFQQRIPVTLEERAQVPGGPLILTVTNYEYDERGVLIGQSQISDGKTVYEDTEISGSATNIIRYRTLYTPDGEVHQKIEENWIQADENTFLEGKYAVYQIDENGRVGADPIENWEYTYDSSYNVREYKSYKVGEIVRHQKDFVYGSDGEDVTYKQKEGDGPEVKMYHRKTKSDGEFDGGYEIYVGEDIRGTLVEKRSDYYERDFEIGYIMRLYDSDGENPEVPKVTTQVRMVYEWRTFTY
jgi:hypothetical protein